jgi:hypothetical protein
MSGYISAEWENGEAKVIKGVNAMANVSLVYKKAT